MEQDDMKWLRDKIIRDCEKATSTRGFWLDRSKSNLEEVWAYANDAESALDNAIQREGTPKEDEETRRLRAACDEIQKALESIKDLIP